MAFELEGGGDAVNSFDDHSVTIASDGLGTLKFSGNGGSSAVSAETAELPPFPENLSVPSPSDAIVTE